MNPGDIHGKFEQAFNSADRDALLALYEPEATLLLETGPVAGVAGIGQALAGFLAMKPVIRLTPGPVVRGGGDLAVLRTKWTLKGTGPDGQPVEMSGQTVEVVRRGSDGLWRYAIDCPFGVG